MKRRRGPDIPAGTRFGRLVVTKEAGKAPTGHLQVECKCDCGTIKVIRKDHLTRQKHNVSSCGCLLVETITVHGYGRLDMKRSTEYVIWLGLRDRCNNPRNKGFYKYGARGIIVCKRWDDFALFLADMGPRPSPQHSVDRIDNNGNYEPGNCRWATLNEQARNTRTNHVLDVGGKELTIAEWAERTGLLSNTIVSPH